MPSIIVLAMHGTPPNDFPPHEMGEYMSLHGKVDHHAPPNEHEPHAARYAELDTKMRNWPRSAANDPFWAGSLELGEHLQRASGLPVIVAFNEFCAPSVPEALDRAAAQSPDRVIVITPMMTRGGGHSEHDIPEAIEAARGRHPGVEFVYAWPIDPLAVAEFLAAQVRWFA